MMAVYLLDTNAVSDIVLGEARITARFARHRFEVRTSVIVRGEIRFGIERLPPGKKRSPIASLTDGVLSVVPCEPVSELAADHYGTIRQATDAIGLNCDDNDLWIAATAIALDAAVVSRDKMMPRIPGLRVEDWMQ
jgi:tRNA(fMet)-specific endonuclease VapC